MFDKLKKAFSGVATSIGQKEIAEKDLDSILLELQLALQESDVAQEVTDDLSARLKKELLGLKLEKGQTPEQVIKTKLQTAVAEMFARAGKLDLVEKIREKKATKKGPYVIVFLGINGTGKTTTVAKMANLLRKNGLSLVLAAGDTHRAGAIEQLIEHANRLSMKVVHQRYGADPSSVGRDAIDHAKKNHIDAVLVDTAGRMQTSKNLMDEMGKIVRVVKPDAKIFVGDSLAGNDTINQAKEFFQYTSFDGAILTKIDADAKGGAALSIIYITSKPITYVGIGQGYDDMIPFDPDKFIQSVFGSESSISVESLAGNLEDEHKTSALEPTGEEKEERTATPIDSNAIGAIGAPGLSTENKVKEKPLPTPQPVVEKIPEKPTLPAKPVYERPSPPQEVPSAPTVQDIQSKPPLAAEEQSKEKQEKKSRFGGLFGRKKKEEEAEEEKPKEIKQKNKSDDDKPKEEDKKKGKKQDEGVVYLTDDDIEDLLK